MYHWRCNVAETRKLFFRRRLNLFQERERYLKGRVWCSTNFECDIALSLRFACVMFSSACVVFIIDNRCFEQSLGAVVKVRRSLRNEERSFWGERVSTVFAQQTSKKKNWAARRVRGLRSDRPYCKSLRARKTSNSLGSFNTVTLTLLTSTLAKKIETTAYMWRRCVISRACTRLCLACVAVSIFFWPR